VDPAKIFLTSKFSYLLFSLLPLAPPKIKSGIASRWETTKTHVDQSNYLANQQQVLSSTEPFTSLHKLCKKEAGPKLFCSAKGGMF